MFRHVRQDMRLDRSCFKDCLCFFNRQHVLPDILGRRNCAGYHVAVRFDSTRAGRSDTLESSGGLQPTHPIKYIIQASALPTSSQK
ncbi:hypothetical protein EYR36_007020 [Pleurotus pulmonarius]|nr:hypothetical protein EYR36_007020 [Pleurotus pulmonarius]